MSHSFYILLHVSGLALLALSLGGMVIQRQSSTEDRPKILSMFHGIGLVLILVAGFGLLARNSISFPWPLWVWVKLAAFLFLGAFPSLAKRFDSGIGFYVAAAVIIIAAAMGVMQPF